MLSTLRMPNLRLECRFFHRITCIKSIPEAFNPITWDKNLVLLHDLRTGHIISPLHGLFNGCWPLQKPHMAESMFCLRSWVEGPVSRIRQERWVYLKVTGKDNSWRIRDGQGDPWKNHYFQLLFPPVYLLAHWLSQSSPYKQSNCLQRNFPIGPNAIF